VRVKHATIWLGVLILGGAWVMADHSWAPWREQSLPAVPAARSDAARADSGALAPRPSLAAAPASPADAPHVDLEALKQGPSLPAGPPSPADAPRVDLEALKRGQTLPPDPVSPADAPRANLEEIKRLGMQPVRDPASERRLEKETERLSQMAIQAIPLERGSSGAAILPFPDANGRPIPIGGL